MPGAPKLDTRHAHSARVYNYWLGGKDNFAADRDAAEQAIATGPRSPASLTDSSWPNPAWSSPSGGGPTRS
jgi:hypothetical protein